MVALLAAILVAGCAADATIVTPSPAPEAPPAPEHPAPEAPPVPEHPAPEAPHVIKATVSRHTDGDTARFVLPDNTEEKVRFIGMDTPEVYGKVEPFGAEASAFTADAIPIGTTVWLETDVELRDRYGRMLAYVWLEPPSSASDGEIRSKMLNARLVLAGYAQVATFPPNVRYVEHFTRYQTEAREANRGLWGR